MNKYDLFDGGKHSQAWEYSNHRTDIDPSAGHCHAWCGAAIYETQPTTARNVGGVNFSIKDQKALLTECYYNDVGNLEFKYNSPGPGLLWYTLNNEIRGDNPSQGNGPQSFVINIYPGTDQVWNYPVVGYCLEYTMDGITRKANGSITLSLSDCASSSFASDIQLHTRSDVHYHFRNVYIDMQGKPYNGEWSEGCYCNGTYFTVCYPRAIWRPKKPDNIGQYCANPELNKNKVNYILTGKWPVKFKGSIITSILNKFLLNPNR
jgi:hypothetical protein